MDKIILESLLGFKDENGVIHPDWIKPNIYGIIDSNFQKIADYLNEME